ncbi:neuronal PAS domain protein [Rhynchospora pubera]|uniref:Neuronal PAS domain protein n=1 Tax=Rhynchospora pubera TaxID=906938 RepID=A0AAV8EWJ2_9POAL|nr:neuronal PAS domain protein [Rhynchospora pubera]
MDASAFVPDVWAWICNLPPFSQWKTSSVSLCICTSTTKQPSMFLSINKNSTSHITLSIVTNFHVPVYLWTSSPIYLSNKMQQTLDEPELIQLFVDIINWVLRYGPNKKYTFRLGAIQTKENFKNVFNLACLTLVFVVCIYEAAPHDLRRGCVDALKVQLTSSNAKEFSKYLVRILGANLEEEWMRTLNLATTNWISEIMSSSSSFRIPSVLFSYAVSAIGLWKVQLYCPVIAMNMEESSSLNQDERLAFSLKYQHVEGVVQLAYKTTLRENWVDVEIKVDNVRCDITSLVSETLMAERGYGSEEKHFPSRISLQITPLQQSDVISVSVTKSSDNPTHEVGFEKNLEGSFEPPNPHFGIKVSANENVVVNMKPWKFEQSVHGSSAMLDWSLHDGVNGREVVSSKPAKFSIFQPRVWFRDRYSSAYWPFTRQGGVVFARDEYGESVCWKMCPSTTARATLWEVAGCIWLTYWPNKQRTFYSETRRLEFRECLSLPLSKLY